MLAVELLRLVAVPTADGHQAVVVDTTGHHPGRGAWLHPDDRCLSAAVRRRAFTRALRITGSPDVAAVVEHFAMFGSQGDRSRATEAGRQETGTEVSTP